MLAIDNIRISSSFSEMIKFLCLSTTLLQPVADKPFTLEAEVDDLPKETLKAQIYEESSGFPSTCFNGRAIALWDNVSGLNSLFTMPPIPIDQLYAESMKTVILFSMAV